LIGNELSNREIADRLTISPRTATTHVERILAKLNLHSRVEVALRFASQTHLSAAGVDARKSSYRSSRALSRSATPPHWTASLSGTRVRQATAGTRSFATSSPGTVS